MNYLTLDKADLKDKKVLLRAGFDVPMEDGKVVDTSRIEALVPTMKHILDAGASLIIMAHQGRPKAKPVPEMSQKPIVSVLKELLGVEIQFAESCIGEKTKKMAEALKPEEVLLLENLRYEKGEKSKVEAERDDLAKELAALGDLYVNDAFTNCHRDHASMTGVPKLLPSYMGLQVQQEVENLSKVLDDPRRPVVLIISGLKLETKVPIIQRYLEKGDDILLGGAIANTFIAARGFDVGKSKYEEEYIETAMELMLESEKEEKAKIHVPRDVVLASKAVEGAEKICLPLDNIVGDMAIFDVGKITVERYREVILKAGTIVWNGPLGLYEINRFSHATKRIAEAVAEATKNGAFSVVGGGDTLGFHELYDYPMDKYSFVSTAGGAMMDFVSGKELPALVALEAK